MDAINRDSRTSVHFGISYVIAAAWPCDKTKTVAFQKALLDNGLDFSQTNFAPNRFTLFRVEPSNLQIKLESPGPQVSSIHVLSANPQYDLDMFTRDTDAVCRAYQQTFPAKQYQILQTIARIRHLYSSSDHAFKYLWETRLGQSPQDFQCLGQRPVAGGGLRLIMPPHQKEGEQPCSIELRIESFLREMRKLFIETAFTWPKARMLAGDERFDAGERLRTIENYATNEVWTFLTQEKH